MFFQLADDRVDGRGLLTYGHIDTFYPGALLVDNGVDSDGGLAGLAIADDQLTLAAADGHHGIKGFKAGLYRLAHGLPGDNSGGDLFDWRGLLTVHLTLAVDGYAQGIDDPAQ